MIPKAPPPSRSRAPGAVALALLGGVLLGSIGAIATAQIYTWTDEQGRRQVSDRPPEGSVKDLKVQGRVSSGPAPSAPAAPAKGEERKGPQTLNEKALEFNKRMIEREEARAKQEKSEAEARERAQRCEQAQAYVRSLQQGGRATRLNPKTGEREYLEGAARDKELADAQRTADSWCKPPAAAPAAPAAPKK